MQKKVRSNHLLWISVFSFFFLLFLFSVIYAAKFTSGMVVDIPDTYIIRAEKNEQGEYEEVVEKNHGALSKIGRLIDFLLGGNISDPVTLPAMVSANFSALAEDNVLEVVASPEPSATPEPTPEPTPAPTETTIEKRIDAASGNVAVKNNITIKNQTSYTVNTQDILAQQKPFSLSGQPQVFILHTHATESYTPSAAFQFKYTSNSRTTDNHYNMVRVGQELKKVLESKGIGVIHDTSQYDYPSYNDSYNLAYEGIQNAVKKYPSIQIVLDLHRDALNDDTGEKIKLTGEINGEKVAQVMMVVGTDECGFSHPYWKKNLKFATMLQEEFLKLDKSFVRPINLRKSRFNQQFAPGSLILEIGTNGNTLDEALASANYIGEALAKVIEQLK